MRNKSEASNRKRLFNEWRMELCDFSTCRLGRGSIGQSEDRIIV